MRVFDFSNQTEEKVNPECTYTTFRSNEEISTCLLYTSPSPRD